MSEPLVTMGDISDIVRGVTYEKAASRSEPQAGYLPLLRATNINEGQVLFDSFVFVPEEAVSEVQRIRHNDIILAASSGSLSVVGKAALVRKPWSGTFGAFCYVIRPKPDLVLPEFLGHFMQSAAYRRRASELAAGVNINNLRREHVLGTPVPYVSLEQQRRIVDALDSVLSRLDAAVASLEAAQRKLKAYRASVLKAAVEGRLVPTEAELARKEGRSYEPADMLLGRILKERRRRWEDAELAKMKAATKAPKDDRWKGKYQEAESPDFDELPRLPDGWRWASCAQIMEKLQTGPFGSSLHRSDYVAGGTPVINPEHLRRYAIHPSSQVTVDVAVASRLSAFRLTSGDVILGRRGEMGRCAIVGHHEDGWLLGTGSLALRPVAGFDPRFLAWVLRSPRSVRTLTRNAIGTTMTNLNQEILLGLAVPLPPYSEQMRIVDEIERQFSLVEAVEREMRSEGTRSSRLRQSVLNWAFEGRLVDQDPAAEPAEAMLARIRTERAEAALAKPTTKRARALKAAS